MPCNLDCIPHEILIELYIVDDVMCAQSVRDIDLEDGPFRRPILEISGILAREAPDAALLVRIAPVLV